MLPVGGDKSVACTNSADGTAKLKEVNSSVPTDDSFC